MRRVLSSYASALVGAVLLQQELILGGRLVDYDYDSETSARASGEVSARQLLERTNIGESHGAPWNRCLNVMQPIVEARIENIVNPLPVEDAQVVRSALREQTDLMMNALRKHVPKDSREPFGIASLLESSTGDDSRDRSGSSLLEVAREIATSCQSAFTLLPFMSNVLSAKKEAVRKQREPEAAAKDVEDGEIVSVLKSTIAKLQAGDEQESAAADSHSPTHHAGKADAQASAGDPDALPDDLVNKLESLLGKSSPSEDIMSSHTDEFLPDTLVGNLKKLLDRAKGGKSKGRLAHGQADRAEVPPMLQQGEARHNSVTEADGGSSAAVVQQALRELLGAEADGGSHSSAPEASANSAPSADSRGWISEFGAKTASSSVDDAHVTAPHATSEDASLQAMLQSITNALDGENSRSSSSPSKAKSEASALLKSLQAMQEPPSAEGDAEALQSAGGAWNEYSGGGAEHADRQSHQTRAEDVTLEHSLDKKEGAAVVMPDAKNAALNEENVGAGTTTSMDEEEREGKKLASEMRAKAAERAAKWLSG